MAVTGIMREQNLNKLFKAFKEIRVFKKYSNKRLSEMATLI